MNIRSFRNYCKSPYSLAGIYILSAVRTPTGLLNGLLSDFTAPQLGSFAIKEALQRAAVPPADLENIFLECVSQQNCHEEIIKRTGLSKTAKVSISSTSSLAQAVKFLLKGNDKLCMAGGMESVSRSFDNHSYQTFIKTAQDDARKLLRNNLVSINDMKKYEEHDYNNFIKANRSGAFFEEIVKIDFRKKGQQILVEEDEISRMHDLIKHDMVSLTPVDGAAAVIMSTEDYFTWNNLVPLAQIVSYAEECVSGSDLTSTHVLAIEKALKAADCKCEDMNKWEMVSIFSDVINQCVNYLNISSSQVNKDGGILGCGFPTGLSGLRGICHLVHSLSAGELGCASNCDFRTASAMVVKRLKAGKSSKPLLTLYTKQQCPLCDELKHQLKPFEGRFSMVEVDIEGSDEEKYKELYQYEIPVLFLDGIFLCKHRLDVEHFERRLLGSEGAG